MGAKAWSKLLWGAILGVAAGLALIPVSQPATASSGSGSSRPSQPATAPAPQPARPPQPARQAQPAQPQQPSAAQQQPAPAPPPAPVKTEILTHDNWRVTCHEFAEGKNKRVCTGVLQVVQQNSNQVIFAWTIGQDTEGRLISVFQTPTGITLTPGLELKLGKSIRKVPFVACEQNRCTASVAMDDAFVREVTAAENAEAIVYGTNGRGVQFGIPLKGVDKAIAASRRG